MKPDEKTVNQVPLPLATLVTLTNQKNQKYIAQNKYNKLMQFNLENPQLSKMFKTINQESWDNLIPNLDDFKMQTVTMNTGETKLVFPNR